jgi:hypothetical protein
MKGFYFTFLDADDRLPVGSLQVRVNFALDHPEVDMISGHVHFFTSTGVMKTWEPSFAGDPLQSFIRIDERAFCNPALFIKNREGIQYRFRKGMTHVEDLLFFTSLAAQQKLQYNYVQTPVYEYRVSEDSAMSNLEGLERGYWTFYEQVKSFPGALNASVQYLKWRVIRIMFLSYMAAGQWMNALRVLPKMISK